MILFNFLCCFTNSNFFLLFQWCLQYLWDRSLTYHSLSSYFTQTMPCKSILPFLPLCTFVLLLSNTLLLGIQLTLEYHRFELHGSSYKWIFFNSMHHSITRFLVGWLSLWMRNCGYGRPTIKLYMDFLLHRVSTLSLHSFQGWNVL